MKKRSLLAAVAMLIVSAIVLTSSTYAWFASSSTAAVSEFSASVTNNNGALRIAPIGSKAKAAVSGVYSVAVSADDYQGLTQNLTPVSMSIAAGEAPVFTTVSFQDAKFTNATTAADSSYLKYDFNVQYVNGASTPTSIEMTPTANRAANLNFTYALIGIQMEGSSTSTYYMINFSDSYAPVKAITATEVEDTVDDSVIGSGDTGYALTDMGVLDGATVTPATDTAIEVFEAPASATTTATVSVWVWAEGQDLQCNGSGISNLATTIEFALSVA